MNPILGKRRRPAEARPLFGAGLLAVSLALLSGCATTPLPTDAGGTEPSVARIDDGREGFIITEHPTMDDKSRRQFDHAVALLNAEAYDQAIGELEQVIARSPGVTAPYIDIAIAYERTGQFDKAERHLQSALALVPEHPVAQSQYAMVYRKTGRFAQARDMYEQVVAGFPEYYPAHRNLGVLCDVYLNDPACALRHYQRYREAVPDDEVVQRWIAELTARTEP